MSSVSCSSRRRGSWQTPSSRCSSRRAKSAEQFHAPKSFLVSFNTYLLNETIYCISPSLKRSSRIRMYLMVNLDPGVLRPIAPLIIFCCKCSAINVCTLTHSWQSRQMLQLLPIRLSFYSTMILSSVPHRWLPSPMPPRCLPLGPD